jgi:2-keto-4-pentenoate hydratase/2-oxohepta-3-ene-1,7-dioic acid hydratase in catechol pathway
MVRSDGTRLAAASHIARNLQVALDDWDGIEPPLREMDTEVENGRIATSPVVLHLLQAPLPRAYEWVDGSAYLNHMKLLRRARGTDVPILGSGTISNADTTHGVACLTERRMLELLASQDRQARTAFLRPGDKVAMEAIDERGRSVFGRLEQKVIPAG